MPTTTKVPEPWELMKQLRLADTGELREVLERFQRLDEDSYAVLAQVIKTHTFRRTFTE